MAAEPILKALPGAADQGIGSPQIGTITPRAADNTGPARGSSFPAARILGSGGVGAL